MFYKCKVKSRKLNNNFYIFLSRKKHKNHLLHNILFEVKYVNKNAPGGFICNRFLFIFYIKVWQAMFLNDL